MNIFQIGHQLFLLIVNILMAAAINVEQWGNIKTEGNSADGKSINGNNNNGIVSHHLPIGPVVLVTGGAAGIGYNLVKELINDPSVLVIIAADINETHLIKEMVEMYSIDKAKAEKGRKIVMYLSLDVANEKSIQNGFNLVKEKLQEYEKELEMNDLKLSTLINNAGIMQTAQNEPGVDALTPKKDVYMKHLEINAVGPALIIGAFRKIMPADMTARMVFISSTVGSMNKFQGIRSHRNTAYGMSKAAMNLYMLSIAHQQKWLAISICPGWVDTDIGNQVVVKGGPSPTKGNDAAKGIIKMIEGMNKENNGKFYSLHFNDFIPF